MESIKIFFGFIFLLYFLFFIIGSFYLIKKYDGFRLFYSNLNKIFKYQDRAVRIEYASFVMIMTSVSLLFDIIFSILSNMPFIIDFLVSLLFKLSTISVTTRRLHDLGYSGWLQAPIIIIGMYTNSAGLINSNYFGAIFILFILILFQLFLMFKQGQQVDNQYGKTIK